MSLLPQADHILVLVDGEITESGSYQELLSRHGAFADFIHTFANTERKESAIQRGEQKMQIFACLSFFANSCFLNILLKKLYYKKTSLSARRKANIL